MLLKTPLYDDHVKLGARMVEFGGWDMPVQYTSVIDEHQTTRNCAGLFDICHMGEFMVEGKDALEFLQKVVSKDINKLEDGKAFYAVLCNEKGGVVDDMFLYRFSKDKFMIVVNASTIKKDFDHITSYKNGFEAKITDISEKMAKIDIQGPKSEEILKKLASEDLREIKRFEFREMKINAVHCIVSRTGYTGEDGFELYFDEKEASHIWNTLLVAGKDEGIKPIGLGARDTLRLECCYSLYGHELSDEINPLEAGIGFTVSLNKEFVGSNALREIKENMKKRNVAIELERGIPREHYEVTKDGKVIGMITSGTMSPTFKKGIGMAMINKEHAQVDNEIEVIIRERPYKAKIVKKPFYTYKGKA